MKTTRLPSSKLDRRLVAYAAAGVALAAPAVSSTASAAVVYSGPLSITLPQNVVGVYLDLVTGVTTTAGSALPGYDINAFGSNALEFFFPSSPAALAGVVGTTAAGATALTPLVSTVSSTSGFLNGVVTGTAFDTIGTEFAGIEFKNDITGVVNYGWVEFMTASTTGYPATIIGYGYENAGNPIIVGAIPEPGTAADLGFGALSLGAAGVRRWRKARQAVV